MKRVLITAFEPYDVWNSNSSWDALVELTKDLPTQPAVTTRLYPVNYQLMQERIWKDLEANYDVAIHLGQSPGSSHIQLEAVALNIAIDPSNSEIETLIEAGPVAYQTSLPISQFNHALRSSGIPSQVSFNAGNYLCNAIFYMSQHIAVRQKLETESLFIHLPLDPKQAAQSIPMLPSMSSTTGALALKLILHEIEPASELV